MDVLILVLEFCNDPMAILKCCSINKSVNEHIKKHNLALKNFNVEEFISSKMEYQPNFLKTRVNQFMYKLESKNFSKQDTIRKLFVFACRHNLVSLLNPMMNMQPLLKLTMKTKNREFKNSCKRGNFDAMKLLLKCADIGCLEKLKSFSIFTKTFKIQYIPQTRMTKQHEDIILYLLQFTNYNLPWFFDKTVNICLEHEKFDILCLMFEKSGLNIAPNYKHYLGMAIQNRLSNIVIILLAKLDKSVNYKSQLKFAFEELMREIGKQKDWINGPSYKNFALLAKSSDTFGKQDFEFLEAIHMWQKGMIGKLEQ